MAMASPASEPDFRWLYGDVAPNVSCQCGALFSPRRAVRSYRDEHHSHYEIIQHDNECDPCWLKRVDAFVHSTPIDKRMMWINDFYPHGI
jgi:hypothetical protein